MTSEREKKTVLVTQGAMKHSLAIIQYLARQGYHVHATVPPRHKQALAQLSRHTVSTYVMEEDVEEICVTQLLALLRSHAFDVLIPVGYPVTEFIARHSDEIGRHVRFVSPGKLACELAADKLQMTHLAESLQIATPKTYQLKTLTELKALAAELEYPAVIRGRYESGRKIIAYAGDENELFSGYENLCRQFGLDSADKYPIVQEYIPGWGCGFFAFYQQGVPKRIFMHRRIREYPVSGGASSCAESFFNDDLFGLGRRLLDHLHWHGIAMVECRFDTRTRRFTLIEVNAKFWGSLELALQAGADFVGDYVRSALGQELSYSQGYRHLRFQWPFDGDLFHALENPSAWRSVLNDLINPSVSKGFHFTDPVPTLSKLYGTGCGIALSLLQRRHASAESRP